MPRGVYDRSKLGYQPYNKGKGEAFAWLQQQATHAGDTCLRWPFSGTWNGYGHLGHDGKLKKAHRLMCELAHGAPPTNGHQAAHNCGNRWCVNPVHLSWKTPRDNQLDRRAHGTARRKSKWSPIKRKLTPQQEAEVRSMRGKKNQREIAELFGISYQQVSLIQRGLAKQPKLAS